MNTYTDLTTENAIAYLVERQANAIVSHTTVLTEAGQKVISIDFRYGLGGHMGNAWVWLEGSKLYGEW